MFPTTLKLEQLMEAMSKKLEALGAKIEDVEIEASNTTDAIGRVEHLLVEQNDLLRQLLTRLSPTVVLSASSTSAEPISQEGLRAHPFHLRLPE